MSKDQKKKKLKMMKMEYHSKIELRTYQKKLIGALKDSIRDGNKRIILSAPT
jgi:superfamily II DNA or RNA helicase